MAMVDTDEAVRKRAYEIWERAGRPSGREHEHWAEAAREIEGAGASGNDPSGSGDSGAAEDKANRKNAGNAFVTGDVRQA